MNTDELRASPAFKALPIETRLRRIADMLPRGWSAAEMQREAAEHIEQQSAALTASRERCKALEERLAWSAMCWDDAARVMRRFGSEDEANECDENAAQCRALLRQGDAAGGKHE